MSDQIAFLKSLIAQAQDGSSGAVTLLRDICVSAAREAPESDLVVMGQCLVQIGIAGNRN